MTDTLLQILISPKLEDAMVDWLLEQPQQLEFETSRVQQYGHKLESLAERVSGFRQQVLFTLHLQAGSLDNILQALHEKFGRHAVSYRALDVTASHAPWQSGGRRER